MGSSFQLLFLDTNVPSNNVKLHSKLWLETEKKKKNMKQTTICQFCVRVWFGEERGEREYYSYYSSFLKQEYLAKIIQETKMNEYNRNSRRSHCCQFGGQNKF